jgi:cytoskeletal protein CcmA (bactofilin family)
MKRLVVGLVLLCSLASVAPAVAADDTPNDRIVVSGPVVVDRGETVKGDVVVLDGDVLIRGKVRGDVVVVNGDLTVRGKIGGDAVTVAGKAILGRAARIHGDLVYFDKKPGVLKGAKVSGDTKKADGGELVDSFGVIALLAWAALSLSSLLLGLLLLLVAPRAADAVAKTARTRWGMSIGVGIAAFIVLPLLAGGLLLTILGIPLGLLLGLLIYPLFAIGFVSTAFVVGRLIVKGSRIPAFLLGLLILCVLSLIPLIGLLAVIFGLGLLFTTLFRVRSA